jgi:(S)-citramalyl-CoA lyase
MTPIAKARSLLFVPGDRPERFAKATASGADLVCIDWEDAVAATSRAHARQASLQFLREQTAAHADGIHACGLRINRLSSSDGLRDVLALQDAGATPAFVMLAKTESAADVALLATHLPTVPLIALIESARGLHAAAAIAQAHVQMQALMLGGVDLAAELGCEFAWTPLLHARSTLVAAAASAGLPCIDVPWLNVADAPGAQQEAAQAAALGFSAKALIHPNQVAPVHAGLRPSEAAVAHARRVVQAAAQGSHAAILLDGKLIDRPVVLAAQRLLRRAGE